MSVNKFQLNRKHVVVIEELNKGMLVKVGNPLLYPSQGGFDQLTQSGRVVLRALGNGIEVWTNEEGKNEEAKVNGLDGLVVIPMKGTLSISG